MDGQRLELVRKEQLIALLTRHGEPREIASMDALPAATDASEVSRSACLVQYAALLESELMSCIEDRTEAHRLLEDQITRAETAEGALMTLTSQLQAGEGAVGALHECASPRQAPHATSAATTEGTEGDEGFTLAKRRSRRSASAAAEAEEAERAAAEAEADALMAGDSCPTASNPYGVLNVASPEFDRGAASGARGGGDRRFDEKGDAVLARLSLQAEITRLHETVGDEARKRMRLEKIVSKLMKELRFAKVDSSAPPQRLDLLKQLERELLQQLGVTSRNMDMLQGTLRTQLKVATERFAASLNSEASKAAERLPLVEGALEKMQQQLMMAEAALEEKFAAAKLEEVIESLR